MSSDRDRALLDLAEDQLLGRYRETIETSARALLERAPNHVDLEDLVQAASLELLKAFRRARASHGAADTDEYLRTRVWGSLRDEIDRANGGANDAPRRTDVATALLDGPTSTETADRSQHVRGPWTRLAVDDWRDQAALLEKRQLWSLTQQAIDRLPPAERRVLQLRYVRGASLHEIGEILGVTQSRASQIHHSALARLKARLRRFAA